MPDWHRMEKLSANCILCVRRTLEGKDPVKLADVKLTRFNVMWAGAMAVVCVAATLLAVGLWVGFQFGEPDCWPERNERLFTP